VGDANQGTFHEASRLKEGEIRMRNSSAKMGLDLPRRTLKPRENGLTVVIDRGSGTRVLEDALETASQMIDYIKLGWCTGYLTPNLKKKLNIIRAYDVGFFFGGTLLEAFLFQNKLDEYKQFVGSFGPNLIEVSNGIVNFKEGMKQTLIQELARDYRVISEVGKKNPDEQMSPASWVKQIKMDLDAGAWKVICEARESGRSGICRENGELRDELIDEIVSHIPLEKLIFETPTKSAQIWSIEHIGPNVNLANISLFDVIPLETLRCGLRADTFLSQGYHHYAPSKWLK
jgi:phosphosulfolactate synthase